MYRLMVVTDSDETIDFLENYSEWLRNGFKRPHYRKDKDTLIEGMSKHHIDAVAVDLSDLESYNSVINYLNSEYPLLPIFHIKNSYDALNASFAILMRCLDKINEDISDDELTYEQRFEAVRNRWLSKYMRGKLKDFDEFYDKCEIYRAGFLLENPCILAKLKLECDDFFQNKWHYGAARLEVALRNFLRSDFNNLNLTIAVDDDETCNILFSNVKSEKDKESNMRDIRKFLDSSSPDIHKFLGIKLEIQDLLYFKNQKEFFESTMIK